MPALFDEWAHVACYNMPTLQTDPNVREFWGQSLDIMWANLFESQGGLGGAIWGFIDETFMMPESLEGLNDWWGIQEFKNDEGIYKGPCIGYGEWGIIDTWRRKKPEFWNTKKAYSPTRILVKEIKYFKAGKDLRLPVYNRFDHTNFDEIKIEWDYKSISGEIVPPSIAPHKKGFITIPAAPWERGQSIAIRFYDKENKLIDSYLLPFEARETILPILESGDITIKEEQDFVTITGKQYSAKLDIHSGLLIDVNSGTETLIKSGPYLNLLAFDEGDWAARPFYDRARVWKPENVTYSKKEGIVEIISSGSYDDTVNVEYKIQLDAKGLIRIDYSVSGAPEGKFIRESGIKFITENQFNKMAWDRKSYWTVYPESHLGMPIGEIELKNDLAMIYRKYPDHIWEMDMKDFYYQGIHKEMPFSKMARGAKENIYMYSLKNEDKFGISVFAKGDKACRLEKNNKGYVLNINSHWDYYSLLWGNYQKNITFEKEFSETVYLAVSPNGMKL
jgi:hypothetical protein